MSDEYIKKIIRKYSRGVDHIKKVQSAKTRLDEIIRAWAGTCLYATEISGSVAKGTSVTLGSDFDLFVSIHKTSDTLKELYNKLYRKLTKLKYNVRKQNVSLGIVFNGLKVDIIPAKKHEGHTYDHSIYISKLDTWTLTNIHQHIQLIKDSGRLDEIRITKIWSKLHKLDFPSFYLELSVLKALSGRRKDNHDLNFQHVLDYLSEDFLGKRIVDPANTNNIISNILSDTEKRIIAKEAKEGCDAPNWKGIIW